MRIFILEDDRTRRAYLINLLYEHDLTWVESTTQAHAFQPPYDLVLLDHDLRGRQLEDHKDNGEAFAIAIKDRLLAQQPTPIVIIHSFNPDGAKRMAEVLEEARPHIAPFRSGAFNRILITILTQRHP